MSLQLNIYKGNTYIRSDAQTTRTNSMKGTGLYLTLQSQAVYIVMNRIIHIVRIMIALTGCSTVVIANFRCEIHQSAEQLLRSSFPVRLK